MKDLWEQLNAKQRRLAVIVAVGAVFTLIVAMLPNSKDREANSRKEPEVRAVLTDDDAGNVRFERLMAQIENMRKENRDLVQDIERMRRDMGRLEVGALGPEVSGELNDLKAKIEEMEALGIAVNAGTGSSTTGETGADGETTVVIGENGEQGGTDGESSDTSSVDPETGIVEMDEPTPSRPTSTSETDTVGMWAVPPPPPSAPEEDSRRGRDRDEEEESEPQSQIRVIGAQKSAQDQADAADAASPDDEGTLYLPMGSILTGTLVTGMDAPTGQGARQEPFPSLLRLKHEAILPNRFRADVRECFVIVGGYGDLSSERAYLRGESISCVREDGQVVEAGLESYTVGEDGKAGLRGRLVSKQGQMLAKAMLAGTMQGFAGAFNSTPVPTVSLDGGDEERQIYQQAFSQEAFQSGAVSGVGKALDRLAQFYIDQADGMFPVIEVDAGREVEIVMIRGASLAIR